MATDFDFIETDSEKLYTNVIGTLMEVCGEALYPGDERRIFGEGLVYVFTSLFHLFNDRAKQRTLQAARGVVLDAIGDRLRVPRLDAAPASAMFRFSVSVAQPENIVIPSGTRVTADGSVYFATQEAGVIPAGALYVDIEAVCTIAGAVFNGYTAGTISTVVDLIPYVSMAINTTTTAGGDDGEPYTEAGDERYRQRIRMAPAALSPGTEAGYKYYAISADPDIVSVAVDCPEDSPNAVNIYALMTGGVLPDADTLQKILDAISDSNIRIMTDHVQALAPSVVEYGLEFKYYCTPENETATVEAIEGDGGAIDQYTAWQSAALGRSVSPDRLRQYLYSAGAVRVDIVSPAYQQLTKIQAAQLSGSPVVTHEVVTEQ